MKKFWQSIWSLAAMAAISVLMVGTTAAATSIDKVIVTPHAYGGITGAVDIPTNRETMNIVNLELLGAIDLARHDVTRGSTASAYATIGAGLGDLIPKTNTIATYGDSSGTATAGAEKLTSAYHSPSGIEHTVTQAAIAFSKPWFSTDTVDIGKLTAHSPPASANGNLDINPVTYDVMLS